MSYSRDLTISHTHFVFVALILQMEAKTVKFMKYRTSENYRLYGIVQIVDDHYQRYMEQEEQFGSD